MSRDIRHKRTRSTLGHIRLLALALIAVAGVTSIAASSAAFTTVEFMPGPSNGGRKGRKKGLKKESIKAELPKEDPSWLATTTSEKLTRLITAGVTSAEIAVATGSSLRAVEDRRRKLRNNETEGTRVAKLDTGIDALFSIFSLLERHKIEPTNIRAWLIGRSAYLEEQRPAILLSADEFELVRDAAIAYATGETPAEFLADRGPLPRPTEPAEV
jgi:hypothetical protein